MVDKKSIFGDFSNLYETRKTIRFELNPVMLSRKNIPQKNEEIDSDMKRFAQAYRSVIVNFGKIIFSHRYDSDESKLSKKIKIKFNWLKTYTKRDYYAIKDSLQSNKKTNQIELKHDSLRYLEEIFTNWIAYNTQFLEMIEDLLSMPEESHTRKSNFAIWFSKINKRSNFEFMYELFNTGIQDVRNDDFIKQTKTILDECKKLLQNIDNGLLPSQSMGQVVEKSSLNYYTVNKVPKMYPDKVKEIENKYHNPVSSFKSKINLESKAESDFNSYIQNLDVECFVEKVFNAGAIRKIEKKFGQLKINYAYDLMKNFKSEQKSAFLQFISQGFSYQDLKNHREFTFTNGDDEERKIVITLLDDLSERDFDTIMSISKEILVLSTKKSLLKESDPNYSQDSIYLKHAIKELRMQRGKLFDVQSSTCAFAKYSNFCEKYREVAMSRGKIKAELKSLEKEQIEADKTNSWALILGKGEQKYILTIPRDGNATLKNAKEAVDKISETQGEWTLYRFESLTLRALDKLCFGLDGTFRDAIRSEIIQKYPQFSITDRNGNTKLKMKHEFALDNTELMSFYQAVLKLDATRRQIVIDKYDDYSDFIARKYDSLVEFEKALKQTCYLKDSLQTDEKTINSLIDKYSGNLFLITSYDLVKQRKNPEEHTNIWLEFWSDENKQEKYRTRINPEIKISFVAKKEIKDDSRKITYRKLRDRYLLSTTVTQDAHEQTSNFAFKETREVLEFLVGYNKEFNAKLKNPHELNYYGFDRGEKELVTLGLFRFPEANKPEFIDIEVWELKKDKFFEQDERGRIVYKNISYFLDREDLFEKKMLKSCIDLSCAKCIKDKLIINGDIMTYLRLKENSAYRMMFDIMSKAQNHNEAILWNPDKKLFYMEKDGKDADIYYFDERYDTIESLTSITEKLENFFKNVKKKNAKADEMSIERSNNLRDSICANIVGIMNYLQGKHFGMMFFEDFTIGKKNDDFKKTAITLGSRVEWKLLQKFQSLNLVPPTYKQVMRLKDNYKLNQLGIVGYIDTNGTSSDCPHCGAKKGGHTENEFKKIKFQDAKYLCKTCGFDSSDENNRHGLVGLDNPDSVATYNIARKGLDSLLNPVAIKMPEKEKSQSHPSHGSYSEKPRNNNYTPRVEQAPQQAIFKRSK